MNPKDKNILTKLVKIANNQQKILEKLAQTVAPEDVEDNKSFLQRAWTTAGLNVGVKLMSTPEVRFTPSATSESGAIMSSKYTVLGFVPEDKRNNFIATFKKQIELQRPAIAGRVDTVLDHQIKTM